MNFDYLTSNKGNLLTDLISIKPNIYTDSRGFFFESWNKNKFNEIVNEEINFCQDNHSKSTLGVLRGLHYQLDPCAQGKLVRCTVGSIFDVAVDIRRSSSTYGEWSGLKLSAENSTQLWIPRGFAHGFLTLSEVAEVQYKASGFWNKECERSIIWNDESIDINWIKESGYIKTLLSPKDNSAPSLIEAEKKGDIFK